MPKYVVRYGSVRAIGVLSTRGGDEYARGSKVIARTNRGLEVGEVLCLATEEAVSHLKDPTHGQILRPMSPEDANELAHLKGNERSEFEICKRHVSESVSYTHLTLPTTPYV